jgi:hypothetical protein
VEDDVDTVRVEEVVVELGVKVGIALPGNPETLRVTGSLNPLTGVIVTL